MHTFFLFCTYAPYPTYASQRSGVVSGAVASMTPFQIRVIYWKYLLCIVCNLIIRFSPNILTESWKRCIR